MRVWIPKKLLLISLLVLVDAFQIPALPEPVNLTQYRIKTAATCRKYSCAECWISNSQSEADVSELTNDRCPEHKWTSNDNNSLGGFASGLLEWHDLNAFFTYGKHYYCPDCSITGPFTFYSSFLNFQQAIAVARSKGIYCSAPLTVKYCQFWSYMIRFRIHFAYFAIPATLFANCINLSTLRKMLTDDAGPALYLHFAEVITDALYNLVINLHDCLLFFSSFDQWMKACQYQQNVASVFQAVGVVSRYLGLMNQAFLAAVIADRYCALTKPIAYKMGGRKKQRKLYICLIVLGCTLVYLPFFVWRLFYPLRKYWASKSVWWGKYHEPIDFVFVSIYIALTLACVGFQAVCSFVFERKFRKFINTSGGQTDTEELKRHERDKQLLLAGTVGLNLATMVVTSLLYIFYSTALYDIFLINKYNFWERNIARMVDPVFSFINGSGALVFHVLLVKSYREAFKSTKLGRLVCGDQIEPRTVLRKRNMFWVEDERDCTEL